MRHEDNLDENTEDLRNVTDDTKTRLSGSRDGSSFSALRPSDSPVSELDTTLTGQPNQRVRFDVDILSAISQHPILESDASHLR